MCCSLWQLSLEKGDDPNYLLNGMREIGSKIEEDVGLPDNVQKLITTRKSHYNTRNSYNSNFLKFCVRTNLRQMSISYRGINVWNKLDPEVKCATSVSDFKNKFKTQLLGNYIKE